MLLLHLFDKENHGRKKNKKGGGTETLLFLLSQKEKRGKKGGKSKRCLYTYEKFSYTFSKEGKERWQKKGGGEREKV